MGIIHVGGSNPLNTFANEADACYGTFLESSRPQTMRIFSSVNTNAVPLNYELTNVELLDSKSFYPTM
jgi:hypothetical protein